MNGAVDDSRADVDGVALCIVDDSIVDDPMVELLTEALEDTKAEDDNKAIEDSETKELTLEDTTADED